MRKHVIGSAAAAALLALSASVFAQSTPSQPSVGGSGTGSVQAGPGGNAGSGSNVGTGSILGTPPSVGASGPVTSGSSRCNAMVGAERESCLLQERASGGATTTAPGTTTVPSTSIPSTGTTGAGSVGTGSGASSTTGGSLGSSGTTR